MIKGKLWPQNWKSASKSLLFTHLGVPWNSLLSSLASQFSRGRCRFTSAFIRCIISFTKDYLFSVFGITFCPSSWPLFLIKSSMTVYGLYIATANEHLDLNSFGEQVGFLSICSFPLGPLCCLPAWVGLLLHLWQNQLSIAELLMGSWLPWGNWDTAITK